jgi:lysophospholipase L1-like esterase
MLVGSVAGATSALALNHGAGTNALAARGGARPQIVVGEAARSIPTPPPDPRPIVTFGDSLTESYGVPQSQSYPVQLAAILGQNLISAPFEGKTTGEAVALLPQALALNPRLMVIEFGTNDSCTGVPVQTALAHLETILTLLDARRISAVLVGTHYDATHHNTSPLCSHYVPYAQGWDNGLVALALRHQAGFVLDVLHGLATQVDHYHPLADGYLAMAERVAPAVMAVEAASRPAL